MNNIVVYLEIDKQARIADVSFELLSKGKELSMQLGCQLEAVAIGSALEGIAEKVMPYGVDLLHIFDEACLMPYTTLTHSKLLVALLKEICPNSVLMGATAVGRDLAPRVAAMLQTGLTAHCSDLRIADYTDNNGKTYKAVLEQIRPAFGDKAMTTIVCPERRPQMATVSAGVMKQVIFDANYKGEVIRYDASKWLTDADKVVTILSQTTKAATNHLKEANVVVAGGYGVGSKKNFELLKELAVLLHGEVGATRAATDAGWIEEDCMIGQTGLTVRPNLYIACGISGQAQHVSGMQESGIVVSINTDADAPMNKIADYVIVGKIEDILPKMINCLKQKNA
jgi:electron transfer flavoprotein alpha subunit